MLLHIINSICKDMKNEQNGKIYFCNPARCGKKYAASK